jgi:hypothetical protein
VRREGVIKHGLNKDTSFDSYMDVYNEEAGKGKLTKNVSQMLSRI